MTVRRAEPDDRPAIRSLQTHLEYPGDALLDAAVDGPFRCRVAVEDGRVVGYAIALPGDPVVLSELVVAPGHRRAGHATALLGAVAADADRVEATTPVGADGAVAFYRARGFTVAERVAGHYEDGTDALRLVRGE